MQVGCKVDCSCRINMRCPSSSEMMHYHGNWEGSVPTTVFQLKTVFSDQRLVLIMWLFRFPDLSALTSHLPHLRSADRVSSNCSRWTKERQTSCKASSCQCDGFGLLSDHEDGLLFRQRDMSSYLLAARVVSFFRDIHQPPCGGVRAGDRDFL